MGSLTGTLSLAAQALEADQGALQVTSNNIANANTPGYSREVPVFESAPTVTEGDITFGEGVTLSQVQGIRDNVVELGVQQGLTQQGQVNSYLSSMNQVQSLFNETQGAGLQTPLSNFFEAFQNLSTNPTDTSLRQAVISAGQTLASAFNQASSGLSQVQSGLNQAVPQAVSQINQLTGQIAQLNGQVQSAQNSGANPSQLIDQRNNLIEQVSGLVGVNNISSSDGSVTLTTSNGALLVAGQQSYNLTTGNGTSGNVDVFSQGTDITENLTGGSLGGYIQARDGSNGVIAAEQSLDQLAYSVGTAVNTQQEAGYDGNGDLATKEPFFSGLPASGSAGAAATISVAITNPSQIAASLAAPPATGDNRNALALANIENQALPGLSGQTATDYYSTYVANIGTEVQQATNEQTAQNLVVQQLQNQKASISGVSLDEESANLIQYQTAYSASARVVNVISQIAQTALTLGQGG
jgi:flagellar hook-associated protein 1